MKLRNAFAIAALAGFALIPLAASAQTWGGQHRDDGQHSGDRDRDSRNRHDRDSNRGNDHRQYGDRDGRNRRDNDRWDEQRRREEQRRYDDQRRREEQRRYEEQRRREEDRRRDEQRRRDEERRRQEQWRRDRDRHDRDRYNRDDRYGDSGYRNDNRRGQQDEWRNIAVGAGLLGALGLLEHDDTLFFAGAAGALYSTWRYDEDRRSNDECCRARALYFGRDHFYRDGRRYDRRTIDRDGEQYYQFVCR